MPDKSEIDLVDALLARDEHALREVVEKYQGYVYGMARQILVSDQLAEEVAQDTFLALWRRPGAFDPARGNLRTFLIGIARNKAIDLVRKEESLRRTQDFLTSQSKTPSTNPPETEQIERRADVKAVLEQLSGSQREALVLAYFGGRTYREVARELGIPEGTAKTRLRDGLLNLRRLMDLSEREAE